MELSSAVVCSNQLSFSFEKSNQYYGFVPNEALAELTTTQSLVYSVVQYLSFFNQKVTPASINKRLVGMPRSTIYNLLSYLKKNKYVAVDNGKYLFRNHKSDRSKDFLTAREISDIHLGYFIPMSILSDWRLKGIDKITFSIVKNLIGDQKEKQISIDYLAKKLSFHRATASASIGRLLEQGYLSRKKRGNNCAFYYRIGGVNMSDNVYSISNYRKRPVVDKKQESTGNATSNPTGNATPIYSNNKSNIYYQDRRESTMEETVELRENNALIFLKDIIDYFSIESKRLEDWSSHLEKEKKSLSDAYTQACLDLDTNRMNDIGAKISALELKEKNQGGRVGTVKNALVDHLFFLKRRPFAEVGNSHIQKIGKGVKALLPAFESSGVRKQAFCLLMNSIICDLRLEFYDVWKDLDWRLKSRNETAMNKAIDNCLKRASKPNYQVNHEIALDFYKKQVADAKTEPVDKFQWLN